jgi:hypothetical protein
MLSTTLTSGGKSSSSLAEINGQPGVLARDPDCAGGIG